MGKTMNKAKAMRWFGWLVFAALVVYWFANTESRTVGSYSSGGGQPSCDRNASRC
jgi:hypothetical protein